MATTVDAEGCAVVKYYFGLPSKIRELINRSTGEWPKTLKKMMALSREVVLRDESVNLGIVPDHARASERVEGFRPRNLANVVCFECNQKGHFAFRCPNKKSAVAETDPIKSNSIKTLNSNYSCVFVYSTLCIGDKMFECKALVDSGASTCYISEDMANRIGCFQVKLIKPKKLELATKSACIYARLRTEEIEMRIGTHKETLTFLVVPGLQDELILGKSWLVKHNPSIDWTTNLITFDRCGCERLKGGRLMLRIEVPTVVTKAEEMFLTEESNETEVAVKDLGSNHTEISDASVDIVDETEETAEQREEYDEEFLETFHEVVEDESTEIVNDILSDDETDKSERLDGIPKEYTDFQDVFSKQFADELPPLDSKYQCSIELKENAVLPKPRKPFSLSLPEKKALEQFVAENLKTGFIRKSSSPIAMGTFCVKKANGDYRTVVDFRPMNEIAVDNRSPIPCIDDIMTYLNGAKLFSKIDLRGAYNLLRIRPGDEWKTAFVCPQGHFEYTVMPFGLKTAPAIFQSMMEDVFSDLIGLSVLVYIDDILIFSKDEVEHQATVREVLRRLRANRLLAKPEKCVFGVKKVDFLGYVISDEGTSVSPAKVQDILDWPRPQSRRELKSFLGTANFSRKFIANFSDIVMPLLALDSKDVKSVKEAWDDNCDEAFEKLKKAMVSSPVLKHVDFNLPFVVETDASDFALGAVLLQPERLGSSVLHPVAYMSRKLIAAERNYSVYDKELLGLIFALGKWHHFLFGAIYPVRVLTDHSNLQYFHTRQQLNNRHLRWKLFLQNYDFRLLYHPGSSNVVADALSRRADYAAAVEKDTRNSGIGGQEMAQVLPDEYWENVESLKKLYEETETVLEKEKQMEIMETRHRNLAAGHFGQHRTLEAISRDFNWPTMRKDVKEFVEACITCQKIKHSRQQTFGKLMPLPVATGPWKSLSMDFIVKLPKSKGYDSILVVVDRFSKMCHLIPCQERIDASHTADLFLKNVVKLHGLPIDIVSDRGPQFVSKFWASMCEQMEISRKLSTAAHPQTDGQTERMNQTLEQFLRAFVNHDQDNWSGLLHFAEMAMNGAISSSTKRSPFEVNYGFNPRFDYLADHITEAVPAADIFMDKLRSIWIETIQNLKDTVSRMKRDTESRRKSHSFAVNDLVWLDTEHLRRERPSRKLDFKRIGPYKIIEKINENAFRLKLPVGSRIHSVINVSKLYPFVEPISGTDNVEPDPDIVNGYEEFEVERILDRKLLKGRVHFLIKWKGYSELHNSWELEENLTNCSESVKEFLNKQNI